MAKQACQKESNHRGPAARATVTRAHIRGREDPNGGPHHHSSSGQGSGTLSQLQGGQTESAAATPLNALPPPSTDGANKLYHQLVEIQAITTAQLAECAHWCWSDPTSSPAHASTG
jgi:hypothetical protein